MCTKKLLLLIMFYLDVVYFVGLFVGWLFFVCSSLDVIFKKNYSLWHIYKYTSME